MPLTRTVYLLFFLCPSFVSAGYQLDVLGQEYEVHVAESPGHRTWIEVDSHKDPVYAQVAIRETSNGEWQFSKVIEGEECVTFFSPFHGVDCETSYHLLHEDFVKFKKVPFYDYYKNKCPDATDPATKKKTKVEAVHKKDKQGHKYILMMEKYKMKDQGSPKLIGTYDEQRKQFFAAAYETKKDDSVERTINDEFIKKFESSSGYDKKKFEVLCPDFHPY